MRPGGFIDSRLLAAILSLGLFNGVGSAQAPGTKVVVQGDGIAAGQNANIAGGITFGIPAKEVHALLEERMRFRSEQVGWLEMIGQSLELGECPVVELVRRVGHLGGDSALFPTHLIDLKNRHDAVIETVASLDAQDPGQAALSQRILEANREGNLEQAEALLIESGEADTLVSVRQGIAAGRDVNIDGDVVFGVPRKAFELLVDGMRRQESVQFARLQRLSEDLSVNRCATASFLDILGEIQIPTEQLHSKLEEIARRHLELVEQLRAMTTHDPEIGELRKQAAAAIDAGDYDAAEGLLKQAQENLGIKSRQVAPLMGDYARIDADLGRLDLTRLRYIPAADYFSRAAKLAFSADKHEDEALYRELSAGAYQDAGAYRKAEIAFLDALEWHEDNPGQSTVEATVTTLNNLGGLYLASSDYANAMDRFEQSLRKVQSSPELEPRVQKLLSAASHGGAADAAVARNNFKSAETHYTRALSLMESVHGTNDRHLVPVMTNWARLKTIRGDYAGAEKLYRRAMEIDAARRNAGDLEAAVTLNNLAVLYYTTGKLEQAEALWRETMEIYRTALGEDHFITLGVNQNLARILRRQGDLAGAETIYQHALSIWERRAGDREVEDNHLVIASLFASLGDLYVTQKRFDEAEETYEEALDIVRSRLDRKRRKQHLLIAGYRNDLAVVYERQGRYDEAAAALKESQEIIALKLGEDHPDYGTVTSNLARVLMRIERLDEAVPLYLTAIGVAENSRNPLQVASRRRRLAELYTAQGKLSEALASLNIARDLYTRELGPDHVKTLAVKQELAALDKGKEP